MGVLYDSLLSWWMRLLSSDYWDIRRSQSCFHDCSTSERDRWQEVPSSNSTTHISSSWQSSPQITLYIFFRLMAPISSQSIHHILYTVAVPILASFFYSPIIDFLQQEQSSSRIISKSIRRCFGTAAFFTELLNYKFFLHLRSGDSFHHLVSCQSPEPSLLTIKRRVPYYWQCPSTVLAVATL